MLECFPTWYCGLQKCNVWCGARAAKLQQARAPWWALAGKGGISGCICICYCGASCHLFLSLSLSRDRSSNLCLLLRSVIFVPAIMLVRPAGHYSSGTLLCVLRLVEPTQLISRATVHADPGIAADAH